MGRTAKYPKLTELAHKLAELGFPPAETIRVGSAKNFFLMPDGKTYAVRLYLQKVLHTIGYTGEEESAARFADMALLHFYPWKVRRSVCPDPLQFNYTIAQAKKDFGYFAAASTLLSELEHYMVSVGLLVAREELGAASGGLKLDRIAALESRVTELEKRLVTPPVLIINNPVIPGLPARPLEVPPLLPPQLPEVWCGTNPEAATNSLGGLFGG